MLSRFIRNVNRTVKASREGEYLRNNQAGEIMMIPQYVLDRICQPRPKDLSVLPHSTPVVSFGDGLNARVATLGLNPSRLEFQDNKGNMLMAGERRLADMYSLGTPGADAVHPDDAKAVYEACKTYFQRNPYRRWFDQLERIITGLGASYYDGSACHLDLVQWATDPVWGKLDCRVRNDLVELDKEFLLRQLRNETIEVLLLNGRSVINGFEGALGLMLDEVSLKELSTAPFPSKTGRFYTGRLMGKITVVGWSINLQSSFGVSNNLREYIKQVVAELAVRKK